MTIEEIKRHSLSPFFWHGWDMNRQEDGGMNIGIWPRIGEERTASFQPECP